MQRSQQTTARFTRLCQIGAVLLAVPILMAIGCPLTVTVQCPRSAVGVDDPVAGTAVTVSVSVSGGQGAATWTTAADNGTVADGTTDAPGVTPTAAGTVTVTVTATDEAGDTATGSCEFDATAAPCTDDAGCDDGLFCNGAETCDTAAGSCVTGTAQCTGTNQSCDEANDACVTTCDTDADCDDGDACTDDACTAGVCANTTTDCDDADACTTDACDSATGCSNTDITCAAGETCVGGTCVTTCTAAAECDDSDPCTDDACVSNVCENTATDVDNGLFCDGTESCDSATGDVTSSGSPCAADEACDEAADACTDVLPCDDDTDCDDGVFCNGAETCDLTDPLAGICAAGTDPCAADETCNETTDACDAPPGGNFRLTLGTDTFNAASTPDATTSGNDTFDASFEVSGGVLFQTINNADNLDARGGTDTLNAQFQNGGTTTPAGLNGLEIFNLEVTDNNPTTLNMLNADSATTINNGNSATNGGDLMITNLATAPSNFGLTNVTEDFTVDVLSAALTAADNSCTLTLSGINLDVGNGEPKVTIQPSAAGNGYETLTVVSQGGITNEVNTLTQGRGTSLATLNISGPANFTIDNVPLDNSVTTVDGSLATGNVRVALGNGAVTVTGGTGDDRFIFANGEFTNADTVNGGTGTDRLVGSRDDLVAVEALADRSFIGGIEELQMTTNALNSNFDLTKFSGVSGFTVDSAITGGRTVTLPDNATVALGANAASNDSTGTNSFTVGGVATTDTMNLTLNDSDFPAATQTFNGIENLNITSNLNLDGTAAEGGGVNIFGAALTMVPSAGGNSAITVDGTEAFTFTGAVTAGSINAGSFTHVLMMGATSNGSMSITGGTQGDTLMGSDADDTINGGAGADTIRGNDGSDSITGGAGIDTFQYTVATDGGAANAGTIAGADVIADFAVGTGGDVAAFDGGVFGATAANAQTIAFTTITSASNGTSPVGVPNTNTNTILDVLVCTTTLDNWAAVNQLIDTGIAGVFTAAANDEVVLIVNVTGIGQIMVYDPNVGTANDLLILATFNPTITIASLVAANFDEYAN